MATARITKRYADDTALTVEVEVRDSFPDSVAEAVAEVLRLWCLMPEDDLGEGDE